MGVRTGRFDSMNGPKPGTADRLLSSHRILVTEYYSSGAVEGTRQTKVSVPVPLFLI